MKVVTENNESAYLNLIDKIKKEIEVLKKHKRLVRVKVKNSQHAKSF